MERYLERYVRLIIDVQLKLIEGDNLSINTEARSMNFARYLAGEAVLTTRLPVMIVETAGGKVVQAYPIDPKEKDIFRPEVGQAVMCHIVDLDNHPYNEREEFDEICKDAATLGHWGALADPVFLDRRISVPWANIPYPGPRWATALRGQSATESEAWELFATIMRLGSEWSNSFWEQQATLLSWRKKRLDALSGSSVRLIGNGWSLRGTLAENTHFCGGSTTLASGRSFIPTLPIQAMIGAFDVETVEGTVEASTGFHLFGTPVVGASFTIEAGRVVSWDAWTGDEALAAFFAIDEGARRVSSLALSDANTFESRYLGVGLHPHFFGQEQSAIAFGGFPIDTLDSSVDEEMLGACGLNDSLVRLMVPIGGESLSVTFTVDGEEIVMMEEGVFNE